MLKKSRPDGTYLGNLPHFTRMLPYLMPVRTDATIFFEQEFEVTDALRLVRERNSQNSHGGKLSFFHLFLCAAVRTVALRPKMNRFVSGLNYYQRNQIVFDFVAKKQLSDEGGEINITIPFEPDETIESLSAKVTDRVSRGKGGEGSEGDDINAFLMKLPRWIIRIVIWAIQYLDYHNILSGSFIKSLPFYATIFFTNVGSVGIDAPLHHNFNMGTCGFFIALGKIRTEEVRSADGTLQKRERVKVTFTYDDRIADGIYCGKAIDLFKDFVEHPEKLETPVVITPALRAELMLKG